MLWWCFFECRVFGWDWWVIGVVVGVVFVGVE